MVPNIAGWLVFFFFFLFPGIYELHWKKKKNECFMTKSLVREEMETKLDWNSLNNKHQNGSHLIFGINPEDIHTHTHTPAKTFFDYSMGKNSWKNDYFSLAFGLGIFYIKKFQINCKKNFFLIKIKIKKWNIFEIFLQILKDKSKIK